MTLLVVMIHLTFANPQRPRGQQNQRLQQRQRNQRQQNRPGKRIPTQRFQGQGLPRQGRNQRLPAQRPQRPRVGRKNQGTQKKPRQGRRQSKQNFGSTQGQFITKSRRYCDFSAHFVSDNLDFFLDRPDGLFGDDWVDANGCESHELGKNY